MWPVELVSSGEPVLVVCADTRGGARCSGGCWAARPRRSCPGPRSARSPRCAEPFAHRGGARPAVHRRGRGAARRACPARASPTSPGDEPEVAFALALAQAELDLRPPLTALYRAAARCRRRVRRGSAGAASRRRPLSALGRRCARGCCGCSSSWVWPRTRSAAARSSQALAPTSRRLPRTALPAAAGGHPFVSREGDARVARSRLAAHRGPPPGKMPGRRGWAGRWDRGA